MKQDSDRERLSCEINEARTAKRELIEVIEQKNTEVIEKNTYVKGYLDKIVFLTDERNTLEGKLREAESELSRCQAVQARLLQEKELLKQHNSWLNEELSDKVDTLLKERRASTDVEMELQSKLSNAEQACKEIRESLQRSKEQAKESEVRLTQTREELRATREEAASKEEHLVLEVETASKLAELYKQSSEEWSKKAVDLEGVIKALEVHLNQVESDHKDRLQKEVESRIDVEKRAQESDEKIEKLEKELAAVKKCKEDDSLFLLENIPDRASTELTIRESELSLELHEDGLSLPVIASGVSGTSLAAALLRDGWSLTKVYIKYQEAVDAWRHERQERKHSQTILQRVLQEIELRAELILEERAEHGRMAEAYAVMEEKLHASVEEQNNLESHLRLLKAELRKQARDLNGARQECSDLQTEVAVLLKECADIKLRFSGERLEIQKVPEKGESFSSGKASDVVHDRLLTFKDIHELVGQNSQLRAVVRSLGHQNEECETKLKETFELELKRRTDDAAQKVATIVKKSEEQMQLIATLQGTVGMYKRLYEEELKSQSALLKSNGVLRAADGAEVLAVGTGEHLQNLVVTSKEDIEKVHKDAAERIMVLEKDLSRTRQDVNTARAERDRLSVEAEYSKEQLQRFVKESENQRKEMDAVLARNVEFSQIITDYQKRLRENAEHVQSVEEKSRRLSVEVSVLEREKELISIAERRACQELSSLSERVHRLQATLDSIDSVREAQESMRSAEKKRLEEEISRMQREWVEMKHELDSERAHTRHLSHERDLTAKETVERFQMISKDLADALKKVSTAETQAHVAEARSHDLEASLKKAEEKIHLLSSQKLQSKNSKDIVSEPANEVVSILEQLEQAREQIDRLTEELDASKNHVEQYKRLAQHNEEILVGIQKAYSTFKEESEKTKEHIRLELASTKDKFLDLEKQFKEKESELGTAIAEKEDALRTTEKEISLLRETESDHRMLLEQAEERIKALKSELEKEHVQWRSAQNNYERQVLLQADTIRELTNLSERNTVLEKELLESRSKEELATADLTSSRVSSEMEKASLQSEIENAAHKMKELQEQNRILLDQVEATSRLVTEQGITPGDHRSSSENAGNDMQDVIRYLRRSKETSDMEISLLKQERFRLQKQLESALHAAEEARANLRREHESTRLTLCSEEEFKALQAQVREMTLLRESNEQLRMENRRNFEECQSLHEKLQRKQEEMESLQKLVRDREVELEATVKNVDLQKAETSRWENRASQLLEKYRTVDVEDYNRLQSELASTQETSRLYQAELDAARGQLQKLNEAIHSAEQETALKDEKIADLERKTKDVEGTVKAETEKYKKQVMFFKRKADTLTKEKDDTRDSLSKQLDELRANANKKGGDLHRSENQIRQEIASQHEQALKENENLLREKDSRIQTLERTLERERDELRKDKEVLRAEKARRQKDRQAYMDAVAKLDSDKQKLMEELSVLKREKESFSENVQAKKTGRKIVRPKIESPVESHIQVEANDMPTETFIEAGETEAEVRDDGKPSAEMLESVSTTSALVIASTSAVADAASGMRKRFSVQVHGDESTSALSLGNDVVPAQKRQRGLESETAVTVLTPVVESIVTVEPSKPLDVDPETVTAFESAASDGMDLCSSDIAAETQVTMLVENSEDIRPQVPSKRSRIVRTDFVALSSTEAAISMENERAPIDHMPEDVSTEERGVQYFASADRNLEIDLPPPLLSPQRQDLDDLAESILLEAPGGTTLQPLPPQDLLLSPEVDESENLVVLLNDVPDRSALVSAGALISGEPGFLAPTAGVLETGVAPELPSTGNVLPSDSGLDVEDGEIEPEDPKETNAESLSQQPFAEVLDDEKNDGDSVLDSVGRDEGNPNEIPGDNDVLLKSEVSHSGALEDFSMTQNPNEGHGEKPRATRQAGRGASSLLVEKARERSINRRAGLLPSPGRRNARGAKRSIGLQRGRINTAADFEEEQGKQDVAKSTESQTAQAAETCDSSKEEK
ncbi:hypothetical protein L7F22_030950 [Adiantum nelumboides]|nr:hypothetical protein [Adiantum nelumboides]